MHQKIQNINIMAKNQNNQEKKSDATIKEAAKAINDISFILSVLLFLISFKTIKTPILKRHAAERRKAWKAHKEKLQKELDEEHKTGTGKMYIDGRIKRYDPYTSVSLRQQA